MWEHSGIGFARADRPADRTGPRPPQAQEGHSVHAIEWGQYGQPSTIRKSVTYEEWLEMPEVEDGTEEVVDGEIIIMPPQICGTRGSLENLPDVLEQQLD